MKGNETVYRDLGEVPAAAVSSSLSHAVSSLCDRAMGLEKRRFFFACQIMEAFTMRWNCIRKKASKVEGVVDGEDTKRLQNDVQTASDAPSTAS